LIPFIAGQVDEVRLCIRQYKLAAIVSFVKSNTRYGVQFASAGLNLQMLYKDLYNKKITTPSCIIWETIATKKSPVLFTDLEKEVKKVRAKEVLHQA
jgi:hypothetical protein